MFALTPEDAEGGSADGTRTARSARHRTRDLHRAWLELVDTDGPFLSDPAAQDGCGPGHAAPVRCRATTRCVTPSTRFEKPPGTRGTARPATELSALDAYRMRGTSWVDIVLRDVAGWESLLSWRPVARCARCTRPTTSSPSARTGALVGRDGHDRGARARHRPGRLAARHPERRWAASPIDRMEELLRDVRRPDRRRHRRALVGGRQRPPRDAWSPPASSTPRPGSRNPATRDAFLQLLHLPPYSSAATRTRTCSPSPVRAIGRRRRGDHRSARHPGPPRGRTARAGAVANPPSTPGDRGEPDPLPADRDEVYQAAVTVMMRVVFLLFAEERGLLPQGELFTTGYGISDELDTPRRPGPRGRRRGPRRHT